MQQVLAFCYRRELRADAWDPKSPAALSVHGGPCNGDAAVPLRMLVVLSELPYPALLWESLS